MMGGGEGGGRGRGEGVVGLCRASEVISSLSDKIKNMRDFEAVNSFFKILSFKCFL